MKTPKLTLLLALLFLAHPAAGQGQKNNDNENEDDQEETQKDTNSTAEESEGSKRLWSATLPGGEYSVMLDKMSSVSIHEYVLDTQLLVTEMVIDTNGRAIARFDHVRPAVGATGAGTVDRLVDRGNDLVDRAGQRANTTVHNLPQKNYPATSHAGMIEYRVLNLNDLKALFKSAEGSWQSNQGKKITLKAMK